MPQLDVSTYFSQIFWLIIFLSIVVWVYVKVFIPKIYLTMRKRLHKIKYDLEQAEHAHEQMKEISEKKLKEIREAQFLAQQKIQEKIYDLEKSNNTQIENIKSENAKALEEFEGIITKQKEKFLNDLESHVNENLTILKQKLGLSNTNTESKE